MCKQPVELALIGLTGSSQQMPSRSRPRKVVQGRSRTTGYNSFSLVSGVECLWEDHIYNRLAQFPPQLPLNVTKSAHYLRRIKHTLSKSGGTGSSRRHESGQLLTETMGLPT